MEHYKNKKFFLIFGLLLILSLVFAFSGCVPPVPEVIDVTGVEIVEEDQSMKVDETLQLNEIITPDNATNQNITWESDNPDVATVSENGLVTALKRGIANITVTTEDGAFTDTIKITVIRLTPVPSPTPTPEKYTLITTVLPADSGTATGDGEYEQGDEVSISATPADGYEFVNWTNDNNNNAVVSEDASYTFNMPGADVSHTANFISVYEVSFQIVDDIPAGASSRQIDAINLSGFKIEIFTDAERNTKKTETETENDGTASVKLPDGEYWFRVSKEGYADYPPENNELSVQRTPNPDPGYFVVDGADVDVTNDSPIFMVHVYNVTIADVVGGTATVTAIPDTDVQHLKTVTVNISGIESGKEFSSIKVIGSNFASTIQIKTVTAGIKYTFTMPTENVTVTVELKDAGCQQAGYIYNGSDYANNWIIGVSSVAAHIEFSKDGEHLFLKAFQLVDDYKNDRLVGYSTNQDNKAYISNCINSIEINWENTGTDSDYNKSYLFVATTPGGNYDNNDVALLMREGSFNRTTDTLDVSGLTADTYFIGVIAKVVAWGSESDVSEIKVHSIKLSEDVAVLE